MVTSSYYTAFTSMTLLSDLHCIGMVAHSPNSDFNQNSITMIPDNAFSLNSLLKTMYITQD